MAKKGKKIEKETRRLIEGISDQVKRKGDRYKFKHKKNKKLIKRVKKDCVHWIIRKGKEQPTVHTDAENGKNWRCDICGASFPIRPGEISKDAEGNIKNEYIERAEALLEFVNQIQFWSVKLGGDADDTKMFLRMKTDIPRFEKVAKQVVKQVNKRSALEGDKKSANALSQFNSYAGFNYNNI